LLLRADLNRHHVLWGGAQAFIEVGRTDEAEPIIDSMQENAVTSLLPSVTVTCRVATNQSKIGWLDWIGPF
jgi:hypothetical protein